MKRYYLSVDGGGSFTEMCVADEHGQVLFTLTGGSTSFKSVGNPTAFANLRELARQLEIRGIRPDELICGVWGMSGCDTPEDQMVYEALIQQAGFRMDNARVMNDAMLSYRAAAEGAGIVIIAGTGSVVMGLDSPDTGWEVSCCGKLPFGWMAAGKKSRPSAAYARSFLPTERRQSSCCLSSPR